jgi:hypothetical protein
MDLATSPFAQRGAAPMPLTPGPGSPPRPPGAWEPRHHDHHYARPPVPGVLVQVLAHNAADDAANRRRNAAPRLTSPLRPRA